MPVVTKPDLTRVWASGAPASNIEDPDVTFSNKFLQGWNAEVPLFEHFNFLFKMFSQGLVFINQEGIGSWDSNSLYGASSISKGSDGVLYISTAEDTGTNPVNDDTGVWIPLYGKVTSVVTSTSSSYTLLPRNMGGILEMNNASANDVVIPLDSSFPIPYPSKTDIVQIGAGLTTIVPQSGSVTVDGDLNCAGQGKAISLYKKGENLWRAVGGVA